MAPRPKTTAVMINNLRRPRRSARTPPATAPTSDPSKTELTTISSMPGGKREILFDEQDGPGDDTDVIAEEHAAQRRDGRGEIDKTLRIRLGVGSIVHPSYSFEPRRVLPSPGTDANDEVLAFPMTSVRPVESEFDLLSFGKRLGRQIGDVNPQPGIVRRYVLDCFPIIGAPVNDGRRHRLDAQYFAGRHRANLVVKPPHHARGYGFLGQVALHGLRRQVEELPVVQ